MNNLPKSIPIFPLAGALLLPKARLPLNIFEPKYLKMLEDVLGKKKSPNRHDTTTINRGGEPPQFQT